MFESMIVASQPTQTELSERPAIVQVTDAKGTGKKGYDYELKGYCDVVTSDGPDAPQAGGLPTALNIFPGRAIQRYRMSQLPQSVRDSGVVFLTQQARDSGVVNDGTMIDDLTEAKISILKMPSHGQLLPISETDGAFGGGPGYSYLPNPGYIGVDSLTALVEYETVLMKHKKGQRIQQRIKVNMDLVVVKADSFGGVEFDGGGSGGGAELDKKANECMFFGRVRVRRVSVVPDEAGDIAALQQTISLSTLLANATTAFKGFSDLPGLSTGQAVNYQITLDSNAAGHGWYIDPTPLDNTDDYLPTADPYIWKAIPGSASEGRMDLLTVLLHEYGHVLGLEHSADSRNFMGTTLQPGVRRLPTAAELQLMSELIAQVKAEQLSAVNSPLPLAGEGAGERAYSLLNDAQTAHNLGAVNPTLLNGDFSTNDTNAWIAEGEINVTGNTVTLHESPTRQTHLAQAFMVGEGDRSLTFTISAPNLTSNGKNGPSDAFEVALLDADTGLPAVGIIDLTRTDALLNIQADGTERLAQSVRKVVNNDDSATYTIDLPQSLSGKAVLLSFDLLGFAAAESSVTLRDIRLQGEGASYAPIANNDTFTGDEDASITGNLLTNDSTDGTPITQIDRLTAPQHGTLTINANGSFTYTPGADYNGIDGFTYRLTDTKGRTSNTATVSLTVLPVNDAPIAPPDRSANVKAGESFTFNPLTGASDVDGDILTVQWLKQPEHGTLTVNADGSFTYTANPNYAGADSIAWRVKDDELTSNNTSG